MGGRRTAQELEQDARRCGMLITPSGRVRASDAAVLAGYKPRTLRAWRDAGIGPAWIRVNGRAWYELEALSDWLNGRSKVAESVINRPEAAEVALPEPPPAREA